MLLLLTAVFVPYLVLAALSLRMIGQERQLEARRTVEVRQRRLTLVGQQLLSLLENFKLRQLAQLPPRSQGTAPGPPVDKSIALVGPVRESRLRLPWDDDPGARLFRGLVNEAARVIRFPLTQSGFTLNLAVERTLPPIEADRDALLQAILNLLTNAMKYSGTSRRIGIDLRREGDDALIAVTDYGVGIAPEEQGRIFERFYRAPASQGQYIPGAGLGLTLVAHIAKAHGGDVAVRSSPGAGSTFTIRLPIGAE